MRQEKQMEDFRTSVAFKSGQQYERRRLVELLRNRQSDLRDLTGPPMLMRNARQAMEELRRVIDLLQEAD